MNNFDQTVYYFAYGSNMSEDQMSHRIPAAKKICSANIKDYQLVFDVPATYREGSVANIRSKPNSILWGVIWQIPAKYMSELDRIEDLTTYDRKLVEITVKIEESIQCYIYKGKNPVEGLLPEKDYLEIILQGAKQANLPEDYIKKLSQQKTLSS